LLALGFSEVITSSFRNQDEVQLMNALASDKSCLRSHLTPNISETLDKNASFTDLLGTPDTRVFEIGTVFYKSAGKVIEHVSLALGTRLKTSGYSGKEDKLVQAAQAALEAALGVQPEWKVEKGVAETSLTALLPLLPAPTQYESLVVGAEITYQPFSVYPSVSRDIAMWVEREVTTTEIAAALRAAAGPLLARLTHVDTFEKDGRTSLAFRLVFQSYEKTLDGSEVDGIMGVVSEAATKAGGEVR